MIKLPYFHKGRSGGIHFEREQPESYLAMLFIFLLGIVACFIIIVLRLFQLTIVKGNYYRMLSDQNRIKELYIEPLRGEIKDRKGFVVVKNIAPDLKKNNDRLQSKREYESPEAIAHLIGYRQIADSNDLKNDICVNKLQLGEKTGKKGVEHLYDCELRGKYGKKLIEVDAKGNYLQTLTVLPPQNGSTIQLSFDFELQKKIYDLIKNKRAAVVGVRPKTGEILFLVSSPSFNPQDFEDQHNEIITSLFANQDKPMFNRVTEAVYPPGSLFKLVIATSALEEKTIDDKTLIEDTGTIQAGPLHFGNWYFLEYGRTEGMVDIVKAIRRSNDIFFYKAGEAVGVDKIKRWADVLGYGKVTGIGFDEAQGLIPSPFWKQETLKDRWYLGDTYNMSIGQGYVGVTPLQTVMVTSIFASGGYLCQPQLLKNVPPNCKKLPISKETISLIREGMKEACSPGGTGWPLFGFGISQNQSKNSLELVKTDLTNSATNSANFRLIQTACKTGTAESSVASSSVPHAWMTAFAPFDNPEIALTVLVEEAGQGSDVAGPIIKDILKEYFERSE